MHLTNSQKALLALYRGAADIGELRYRTLLDHHAGVLSARDGGWTQSAFDQVMSALETILEERITAGEVPDPRQTASKIRSLTYWRRRLPNMGRANSRHLHKIRELWAILRQQDHHLHGATDAYLLAMASRTAARPVPDLHLLTDREAANLIEALKDRLAYAYRPAHSTS